jgi:hypothetical protein
MIFVVGPLLVSAWEFGSAPREPDPDGTGTMAAPYSIIGSLWTLVGFVSVLVGLSKHAPLRILFGVAAFGIGVVNLIAARRWRAVQRRASGF